MDIGKLQRAIEGIRRHLAAGDREAAIAHFSETMGIDRKVAEQAIEQMASNQPAAVSQTVELNAEEVGRQIRQILQAVPGGAVAGTILRFAGLDLAKIASAVTIESEGSRKTVHMTLPTMRLPGGDKREVAEPVDAPAGPPASRARRPPAACQRARPPSWPHGGADAWPRHPRSRRSAAGAGRRGGGRGHPVAAGLAVDSVSLQKLLDDIKAEIAAGNMITAIKLYRDATGVGLAEAKEAVELIAAGKPPPSGAAPSLVRRCDARGVGADRRGPEDRSDQGLPQGGRRRPEGCQGRRRRARRPYQSGGRRDPRCGHEADAAARRFSTL